MRSRPQCLAPLPEGPMIAVRDPGFALPATPLSRRRFWLQVEGEAVVARVGAVRGGVWESRRHAAHLADDEHLRRLHPAPARPPACPFTRSFCLPGCRSGRATPAGPHSRQMLTGRCRCLPSAAGGGAAEARPGPACMVHGRASLLLSQQRRIMAAGRPSRRAVHKCHHCQRLP